MLRVDGTRVIFSAKKAPSAKHLIRSTLQGRLPRREKKMANKEYKNLSTKVTPQSAPIPGRESEMVENSAGGYTFQTDMWTRLNRFLILGSEGSTYYASARDLSQQNFSNTMACIKADGPKVVETIREISVNARAPKNTPAELALAMCMSESCGANEETRAKAAEIFPEIIRTGTQLFEFITFAKNFRGLGRGLRKVLAGWYLDKEPDSLAYQLIKYRQREGWSHRDVLRLAHPKPQNPDMETLLGWAVSGEVGEQGEVPKLLEGFLKIQGCTDAKVAVNLIEEYGLPREAIPTELLNELPIWDVLLRSGQGMPMTALLRNLGKMTSIGLVKPMSEAASYVIDRLTSDYYWNRDWSQSKFKPPHPLQILVGMKTYGQGAGLRGSLSWSPVGQVVDALDEAFYKSFGTVEPSGKPTMLALDISGSMSCYDIAGFPLSPREASAAMAMVTARTEKQYLVTGFSTSFIQLNITPRQRLDDVVKTISGLPFGGTDCALPMLAADQNDLGVDNFFVYTDNETWAGRIQPSQALQQYRRKRPGARLAVIAMTATNFSIADPKDSGMLDVVGFDTATPQILSEFAKGAI